MRCLNPGKGNDIFFSSTSTEVLGFNGYRGSFQRIKRPWREADHSPQSTAEVKNQWNYMSAPAVCLHGLHRGNSTFCLL
jgi:hypothetical protein